MSSAGSLSLLATALCAFFLAPIVPVSAVPTPQATAASSSSGYWLANVAHTGTVWGNSDSSYEVFRNVKDFGAKGDGSSDDTAAINSAISSGNRCGLGCNSSTTTPAIIYFPPGNYAVSKPIQMFYYTQVIGDPTNLPVISALSSFSGMALLDSDPYEDSGANWYINQNNFFRQVRNFVIDLRGGPDTAAAIHWQVAQATSLQNIHFQMKPGSGQTGIFMDNGSGGFFSDLLFTGGKIGAFLGSQQFTSRNLTFQGCTTAVFMNWNWGWVLSGLSIDGADVGVDMANSPTNQTVGSVIISDSKFSNTKVGVNSSWSATNNVPETGGTLIIDNVDMTENVGMAVAGPGASAAPVGNQMIDFWASGNGYNKSSKATTQGTLATPALKQKGANSPLLDAQGNMFSRSRPQYEDVSATNIMSAKKFGCKGDGTTKEATCVQNFLNQVASQNGAIAFFDHGAYLVEKTITISGSIKITGECWPLIVADAASFGDQSNPQAVFQVGSSTSTSKISVEISDLLFSTNGPAQGAVMVEWNANSDQGQSGMWDSHVRIGGSAGTNLQKDQCLGFPTTQEDASKCAGVFLMFHATKSSGGLYLENTWFWVADHDMEDNNQTQTSVYSARGALFQSGQGPTWLWGTASEHSMLYNYQIDGVTSDHGFFGGFMQSETPYFQPDPSSVASGSQSWPQTHSDYDDPTFGLCGSGNSAAPCQEAWGLRVVNSTGVLIYSTGFYNFFNNYDQSCVAGQNCQQNMIHIINSEVDMYAVTTKSAVNMLVDTNGASIQDADNRNNFGATIAYYNNH